MDDFEKTVESAEDMPEIEVEIEPSTTNNSITFPTASSIGQTMVNTAAGVICGAVINVAIQGTIGLVRKGKDKVVKALADRKEAKEQKKLQAQRVEESDKSELSTSDEE